MSKVTGYVYSVESMMVLAEITGNQADVEKHVDENYDSESYGLTYSPAFGMGDGLIESTEAEIIDIDKRAASDAARVLGSIHTDRKATSSRENGKLGGRSKGSKNKTH